MQDSDLYDEETVSLMRRLNNYFSVLGFCGENNGNSAE